MHRTVTAGVVGGTAAHLSGGDFEQGAVSAMIVNLVNNEQNRHRNNQNRRRLQISVLVKR